MRIRHADDANKTDGHRLSLLYINKLWVSGFFRWAKKMSRV